MRIRIFVPIEVEIATPDAAMDAFISEWGDDLENPHEIAPIDLVLYAGRRGDYAVIVPDEIMDSEWIYANGRPDEDEMLTRDEF